MKTFGGFIMLKAKRKYKNIVSVLLLIAIITTSLLSYKPKSFANSASASYVASALTIHKTPAWTQVEYNMRISDIARLTNRNPQNKYGKWLNPHVFEHYNQIVVYDLPHGKFYKTSKGRMFDTTGNQGEYQYLGYDEMGNSITNDSYFGITTATGKFTTYKEVT
jgi:hypothetical protein